MLYVLPLSGYGDGSGDDTNIRSTVSTFRLSSHSVESLQVLSPMWNPLIDGPQVIVNAEGKAFNLVISGNEKSSGESIFATVKRPLI